MMLKKIAGIFVAATLGFLLLAAAAVLFAVKYASPAAVPINGTSLPQVCPTQTVQVFFGNKIKDQNMMDCSKTYPKARQVLATSAIGRAALEELLKGPTAEEKTEGYFSSINDGVKINSLTIENGVARVDFDEKMDEGMGGSCRVANIRSQIEKTLTQFPTVKSVVISVGGNSEEALQP